MVLHHDPLQMQTMQQQQMQMQIQQMQMQQRRQQQQQRAQGYQADDWAAALGVTPPDDDEAMMQVSGTLTAL